ncbi:MAG: hypothetical protein QM737_14525 [Ferruginibacter sp.]
MPTKNLDVQQHQQDTDYYCGAACAQMVLAQIGAGLLDQDDLYTDNHNHSVTESGWYTAPDGLQWTMVNRKPASFTNTFVLFALNNEDSISRKIVWTIFHYQVAPIAMVYHAAHWIVVRGYDISADPANSTDNSYSINAFDINNPWPYITLAAPPPPHTVGDTCGSGGVHGVANEHISYNTWQTDYMTGINFGHWNGKFVAICDPLPASEIPGKSVRHQSPFDGKKIIDKKEIERLAFDGIKLYGLTRKKWWKKALSESKAGEPVLVQRLDRANSYYYIIPFNDTEANSNALMSIDARYGDYKQGVILPKPAPHLSSAYNRKEVVKKVVNTKIMHDDDKLGRMVIHPEAYCLYPTLVWKPCRESLSPFWPFHMFTIGSRHVYVRIDGAIFTQLHDDAKGV